MRRSTTFASLLCGLLATAPIQLPAAPLETTAEKSGYQETGDYDEAVRLCRALAAAHPKRAKCESFGLSAERRPLWSLVVSGRGAFTPDRARAAGLPVVLLAAGTHSGEIDGKDAGLALMRDLLSRPEERALLERLVVVFVPIFNVDGHENRGPHRRPNQRGPALQGARTTAQRLNLNRDYVLADAPEMRAMLSLLRRWDPLVYADLHTTDGLKFRHDVALSFAPAEQGDAGLAAEAALLRDRLTAALEQRGVSPLPFYPRLADRDDPSQGFVLDVDSPRHSEAYWAVRNRVGLLVETHAWRTFEERVKASRETVEQLLRIVVGRAPALRAASNRADEASSKIGGTSLALEYDTRLSLPPKRFVDIRGYAYELYEESPIVGGRSIAYFEDRPETWHVPLHDEFIPLPESVVTLPKGGYVVPVAWRDLVEPKLQAHGITHRELAGGVVSAEVMRFSSESVALDEVSFQGHQRRRADGVWQREQVRVPAGSLFVPLAQPASRLIAHLFEPAGPDSLVAWGLFNTIHEVSDHTAGHRELELIRWMHAGDERIRTLYGEALFSRLPAIRADFERRLAAEPGFAGDVSARRAHWLQHLPNQDPELDQYPILRTDETP